MGLDSSTSGGSGDTDGGGSRVTRRLISSPEGGGTVPGVSNVVAHSSKTNFGDSRAVEE